MITLLIVAGIGAMLGLRYKVFALVPATPVTWLLSYGVGIAHESALWINLAGVISATIALQVGYVLGAVIRFGVARIRARKYPSPNIAVLQRR